MCICVFSTHDKNQYNIIFAMCVLSPVWFFETPWTIAPQVLCPWNSPGKNTGMGFHLLLQGDLPDPGIKPTSPALLALVGGSFTTAAC